MVDVVHLDATHRDAGNRPHVNDPEFARRDSVRANKLARADCRDDVGVNLEHCRNDDAAPSGPLMLGIRHDHGAVGELDLKARPIQHHIGGRDDAGRLTVGTDQIVADGNVAHGGPPGGCRQGRIQFESFPHTRPRRDHDHLSRVQAVGHVIEFGEAGRHAAGDSALRGDRVDLVHRRLQQCLQHDEVFGGTPFGDVVDLGLGAVDDLVDVGTLCTGVSVLHHPGASLHESAQKCLLGHDARVVAGVGCGGHRRDQGV